MAESLGQSYALQIALQTMKERCLQLQQRVSIVEEENMKLRLKCSTPDKPENADKSDIDTLKTKIVQLTKQKSQLTHNVLMVATENRQLWNRLSKLTQSNAMSDSAVQCSPENIQASQTALIRSKTFTQPTPPTKLVPKAEHAFSDSSLEDISLKLISNIASEKLELEKQCAQMEEMQNNESFISNTIGFAYPQDELDDSTVAEIAQNIENLRIIKDTLLMQKEKLKSTFELLKNSYASGILCDSCKKRKNDTKSKEAQPSDDAPHEMSGASEISSDKGEKMCPMCSEIFIFSMADFVQHVQNHFLADDNFMDEFEIVYNGANKK